MPQPLVTVRSLTIHAIIASEDIIDAMDLRAFGVGQRVWLETLQYRLRDNILIGVSALLFLICLTLSFLSYGKFWVPPIF